ncbi:DUF4136 domain-containing protein [Spirosoma pollinicola]|uniref:DUF4136 domain-containing protein n=1 Tax=Spirosoma pollinicola TaxID=2057025 RepID=A0A2K8Z9I8_9BACT|nr:DUF4136 domain-containing protein [Spirosoma pollinicola]AUD06536.1 DUF4136 domain-containing protein [Spirosoma pollinicola]
MKMYHQRVRIKWSLWVTLLLLAGGGLTACRENAINDLSPADSPVYITNYDRSVNFSQYKTFSLPDSVIIESNDAYSADQTPISSRFVTNVANAMTARGFQRVSKGDSADLGVAIIRVNNQYTGVASNPYSYYSSYWGYGGLGGYGYSPYYPSYYTYQVTDQYWEVQIVDLKNRPATGTGTEQPQLNVIYDATIRGTDITDQQAVDTAISAIFNQSPYLKATE